MNQDEVFIIAEVGQAHDGSLGILHSYIDAVATTGVNAIKFQTHIAEAESSKYEPFRVKFSYEDETRADYWKRMSFSLEQWKEIKAHCDDVKLEFISSPFSIAAVELLEKVGVNKYKIGSGEVTNQLMLDVICSTKKDIILSSGMSTFNELDATVENILLAGNTLSILQCTTKYPTTPKDVGLNVLSELKERYGLPVGFSDHSGTPYPSLAAVSLGAEIIEAHVVFDKSMFGPDSKSSMSINDFKNMTQGIRNISEMLINPINKSNNDEFKELKNIFEKSLAVNKDLKKGDVISLSDLESKKPSGMGVLANDYKNVIGKSLKTELSQWDFIKGSDLNE